MALDKGSMIRVNQAGEYGAKRIYEGQLAVLKGTEHEDVLRHMLDQELAHLETFNRLMVEGRVRPTALQPLWHVGAYVMGAATALLGPKAAMACTAAVETVIDEHYTEQINQLGDQDPALTSTIEKFRQEELDHKNMALERGAEDAPGYPLLSAAIRGASRMAIFLSKRI